MAGGGTKTTQRLDPGSQGYVDQTRRIGAAGAAGIYGGEGGPLYSPETMTIQDQAARFMNPWFQEVLDPVNASFDRAQSMSRMGVNDQAQGAGAFGSARHGVAQAVGMGEIERSRGQVLGGLLNNQWQTAVNQGTAYQAQQRELERMKRMDPYLRSQMAVGLRNQALGPTGMDQTQKQEGNTLGQIAGLGMGVAGTLLGGPAGGAVASGLFKSGSGILNGAAPTIMGGGSPNVFGSARTVPSGLGMSAGMPGMSGPNPLSRWY